MATKSHDDPEDISANIDDEPEPSTPAARLLGLSLPQRPVRASYQPFWAFTQWADLDVAATHGESWSEQLKALNDLLKAAGPDAGSAVLAGLLRLAAFNSGALSGMYRGAGSFSMSIAEEPLKWRSALRSAQSAEAVRAVDSLIEAYDAARAKAAVTESIDDIWICGIHATTSSAQATFQQATPAGASEFPLVGGEYKTRSNDVILPDGSLLSYAPMSRTESEMLRLAAELNTEIFIAAHPVLKAAYVHAALEAIHAFPDGTGRVARVLASFYLMGAAGIPLLIFEDDRPSYDEAIAAAAENPQAFVTFVANTAVETLTYGIEVLQNPNIGGLAVSVEALRGALTGPGGLTHAEVDEVARRLLEDTVEYLLARANDIDLPAGVGATVRPSRIPEGPALKGYRMVGPGQVHALSIVLRTDSPSGEASESLRVLVATDPSAAYPLCLERLDGSEVLNVRLEDIEPRVTTAFSVRRAAFCSRVLAGAVSKLLKELPSSVS